LEKFNAGVWFGVFAPKDIEPTIVAHMAAEIGAALQTEDIQKRFFDMGVQSNFMPPERFQPFLLAQRARLKTVVEEKKIRVDQ
jgi:tripartite-type tricarboxylate transporter receptor subunit TctC